MEVLVKGIHFLATNLWFTAIIVTILIALQIAIPIFRADRVREGKQTPPYKGAWTKLALTFVTMIVLTTCLFKLPDWSSYLLYTKGKDGTGVITRTEQTNKLFNNQYVMRYFALIKKENGTTVETQFESSDFNIYPSENTVVYPKVGEKFALRYLASDPGIFVILTDKKSEYAGHLACRKAFDNVAEAKIKFESDSLNRTYRKAYAQALEQLLQAECYKGEALEQQFIQIDKETIERLETE